MAGAESFGKPGLNETPPKVNCRTTTARSQSRQEFTSESRFVRCTSARSSMVVPERRMGASPVPHERASHPLSG